MNPAATTPPFDVSQCRSLYVGNLNLKMTEDLLRGVFSAIAPLEACKLIKDKNTGLSSGYGFVDFFDHRFAALALQNLNGKVVYGNELRVNWAFASGQKEDTSSHHHVFVGDLSPEIDDKALYAAFTAFGTISNARVMLDQNTGRSRGYGFVAFRTKEDAERALTDMNGEWLGSRTIRCNWANQKIGGQAEAPAVPEVTTAADGTIIPVTNTTVYVGGIAPDVHETLLTTTFSPFGEIAEIRIQRDKGYAFVRFAAHTSARAAIAAMNGQVIGSKSVKCSWGKEKAAAAAAQPPPPYPHPYPPPAWGAAPPHGYAPYPYPPYAPPPGAYPHPYPPYPYPGAPGAAPAPYPGAPGAAPAAYPGAPGAAPAAYPGAPAPHQPYPPPHAYPPPPAQNMYNTGY